MQFQFNRVTHSTICGTTQSGKTYFFTKEFEKNIGKYPTLYLDPQRDLKLSKKFITFNENSNFEHLREVFKKKKTAHYVGNYNTWFYAVLIQEFFNNVQGKRYLVIDEAHILKGDALKQARRAITGGLSKGLHVILITQRPALLDSTLLSQSTDWYIFNLSGHDINYLKNKGFDGEKIKKMLGAKKYNFVYTNGIDYNKKL